MGNRSASALAHGAPLAAAQSIIAQVRAQLETHDPVFVAVFASTRQPLTELMPRLSAEWPRATVIAASTAGEFTQSEDAKNSVSAFALAGDFEVFANIASGLKRNVEETVERAIAPLPSARTGYPHRTGIVLIDPLAGNAEEATLIAASMLGDAIQLAGGAAGDDLAMKETFVACGSVVASDAIVVAEIFSKRPIGVGVCHGHEAISEPLEVTRADGNVVHEINKRPAWDVWREQTARNAAALGVDADRLSGDQLTAFLLRFEAGLPTGSGYKIRAPLARTDDGALSFACGIPQGAVIRITESVPEAQIRSAREAARRARERLQGAPIAGAIVFDCICRNLILGSDFIRGVRAIGEELDGAPIAGFETYGEVAFDVGDMSGFHNTTTVVMLFPG